MKFSQLKNYPCFQCGRIMKRTEISHHVHNKLYSFICNCLKQHVHLRCEVWRNIETGEIVGQNFIIDNLLIASHTELQTQADYTSIYKLNINPFQDKEKEEYSSREILLNISVYTYFDFHDPESVRNKVKVLLTFQ